MKMQILDRQEQKRQTRWIAMAVASITLLSALYLTLALSTVVHAEPPMPAATPAPAIAATPAPTAAAKATPAPRPAQKLAIKPVAPKPGLKVNVNLADKSQLEKIPGLGPVRAAAIVEYRQSHGFLAAGDLMKVKGIGPALFAKIERFVAVDGPAVASSS